MGTWIIILIIYSVIVTTLTIVFYIQNTENSQIEKEEIMREGPVVNRNNEVIGRYYDIKRSYKNGKIKIYEKRI